MTVFIVSMLKIFGFYAAYIGETDPSLLEKCNTKFTIVFVFSAIYFSFIELELMECAISTKFSYFYRKPNFIL